MPGTVDVDNIAAETENGVLMIHLPKKEEVKPRRIEVKLGEKKNVTIRLTANEINSIINSGFTCVQEFVQFNLEKLKKKKSA